jgi:hypothetical protein
MKQLLHRGAWICSFFFFLLPACCNRGPGPLQSESPLKLLRPVGGETFVFGDSVTVAWTADTELVSSVRVLVSTDNGGHEADVFPNPISSSDSCVWVIGQESVSASLWYPSDSVLVALRDPQGKYSDRTAAFLHVHALKLVSPPGGAMLYIGDTVSIKWRASRFFVSSVLVYVSTGNGANPCMVAGSAFATGDSCRWIVGSEKDTSKLRYPSDSVKVIIWDYDLNYSDTTATCIRILRRS